MLQAQEAHARHCRDGDGTCLWEPEGNFLIPGLHKTRGPKNVALFVAPWTAAAVIGMMLTGFWGR